MNYAPHLTGVLGYAQILNWDDNLTTAQYKSLDVIKRSGETPVDTD